MPAILLLIDDGDLEQWSPGNSKGKPVLSILSEKSVKLLFSEELPPWSRQASRQADTHIHTGAHTVSRVSSQSFSHPEGLILRS